MKKFVAGFRPPEGVKEIIVVFSEEKEEETQYYIYIIPSKKGAQRLIAKNKEGVNPEALAYLLKSISALPTSSPKPTINIDGEPANLIAEVLEQISRHQVTVGAEDKKKIRVMILLQTKDERIKAGILAVKDTTEYLYIFYSQAQIIELLFRHADCLTKEAYNKYLKIAQFSPLLLSSDKEMVVIEGGWASAIGIALELNSLGVI